MNLRLGDKVEALIEATVPNKIIEHVKNKEGGCGCAEKKKRLNDLDNIFE